LNKDIKKDTKTKLNDFLTRFFIYP